MPADLTLGTTRDALFAAVDALCIMAGTARPSLPNDTMYIIERKGCQAVVALKEAGIANNAVIASLAARVTAVELGVAGALLAAGGAQTTANSAQTAAAAAQVSAGFALSAAAAAQADADAAQVTASAALALAQEGVEIFTAENKDAVTVYAGMAVAPHSSGSGFVLASDAGTASIALSRATIAPTFAGELQTGDVLTLPNWTAATGAATLVALATYYLGTTPGTITTTAPTALGTRVQVIGRTISPTSLRISLDFPILN